MNEATRYLIDGATRAVNEAMSDMRIAMTSTRFASDSARSEYMTTRLQLALRALALIDEQL